MRGHKSTLHDVMCSMQSVWVVEVVQRSVGNLIDAMNNELMEIYSILCEDICTKIIIHDNMIHVSVAFMNLGYAVGGFCCRCQTMTWKEILIRSNIVIEMNCDGCFAVVNLDHEKEQEQLRVTVFQGGDDTMLTVVKGLSCFL